MINVLMTVILLLCFTPANLSLSQETSGGEKIYSGYIYQKKQIKEDQACSVIFKSLNPFTHQLASVLPEKLSYSVKINNELFKKYIINIYTNDDEEYSIDPNSEGKQAGMNEDHDVFDSYLIYLIMGSNINHLEIINTSGNVQGRCILDKFEIHNK